jgi:hemin uptake protein HemP
VAAAEVALSLGLTMNPIADNPLAQRPESKVPVEAEHQSRQTWRSEELLGERNEVFILHNGETYRLRQTRQGKLILYK